jgi:hypothetical protein
MKNRICILELKNIVIKIKNSMGGLSYKREKTEKRICK